MLVRVTTALPQLISLNIQGCRRACSPAAFNTLSALTSLRGLVARGCQLQQSAVAALAHLTNLQVRPCLNPLHRVHLPIALNITCSASHTQVLHISDNTALSALDQLTCLR